MRPKPIHYYDPLYEYLQFSEAAAGRGIRTAFFDETPGVTKLIEPLLSSPEVGRLRWLAQAGFLGLVFPSATHDRFAHALGTFHLGCIALDAVVVSLPAEGKDGAGTFTLRAALDAQGWVEEFLVALFLHDLGHFPFSHALENNTGMRQILGDEFLQHEEVACELLNGRGSFFQAYQRRWHGDEDVTPVFEALKGQQTYDAALMCYLITSDKGWLARRGSGLTGRQVGLVEVMHELVSGVHDLDRIDHYRRDSFFSGLGQSFKPYVLLHGLHYHFNGTSTWCEKTAAADGQIRTLLFIRDQLHQQCFGNLRNISYTAMLNGAVTAHLSGLQGSETQKKDAARDMLVMTDGELLCHLSASTTADARSIVSRIVRGLPFPCVATFPKQGAESQRSLEEKVGKLGQGFTVGFSKLFFRRQTGWLGVDHAVHDAERGYVFGRVDAADAGVVDQLHKQGIKGAALPDAEEKAAFWEQQQ